jgi:(2R)-3-sulfolactate dehydrogenase (NADP+)
MTDVTVSRDEAEALALAALVGHGASPANAEPTARAMCLAEAEGNGICGLYYLPIFCAQLAAGKIDGQAVPQVQVQGAVIRVDAVTGFAHPAFDAGLPSLVQAARAQGVAAMSIGNSGNALALGHFVRPLAEQGLIALAMSNAPASVAAPGGPQPVFGTNPLAWAAPRDGAPPIVVDQSMSAATKTAVLMREAAGQPLEPGWAQDAQGRPTLDAAAAFALLPAGGQKGANLALLVEVLSAALPGACLSAEASGLGDTKGGPPRLGQFVLALDPAHFGPAFAGKVTTLAAVFGGAGLRMPGSGHKVSDHFTVPEALWQQVRALASAS